MANIKVAINIPEEKATKDTGVLCENLISKMDKDLIKKYAEWAANTSPDKVNSKLKKALAFI